MERIGRPRAQEYKDLSIIIQHGEVRMRSVSGESSGMLRLSLQKDEVQKIMDYASQSNRGIAMRGLEGNAWEDPMREIGMQMFSALFEGSRMTAFESSQNRWSSYEGNPLRLRLYIEDPDLAALPWEFMHDGKSFLCLSPRFSIVRTVMSKREKNESLNIDYPLKVLMVVYSDPDRSFDKMLDQQIERLTRETGIDRLSLIVMKNPALNQVAKALKENPVHVFHYASGIADFRYRKQTQIMFKDEKDQIIIINSDQLRNLIHQNRDLILAYISMSRSETLAEELAEDLPAVIGIRGEVYDEAIFTFTEGLYRGILAPLTLEESVMQARQDIDRQRPGSRDWGLPVLFLTANDSVFLKEPSDLNVTESQDVTLIRKGGTLTGAKVDINDGVAPGQAREWKKLLAMLSIQQKNLEVLEKKQDSMGADSPSQLLGEIQRTRTEIENLTEMLEKIQRMKEK
jgi:hypothetical protein